MQKKQAISKRANQGVSHSWSDAGNTAGFHNPTE